MDPAKRNLLIAGALLGALGVGGLLPSACAMRRIRGKSPVSNNLPPQRPTGTAKPTLEEDIGPALARLQAWYAASLAPDRYAFNAPATDAQLDAFEHLVGAELPRSYRQLYRWHDGESADRWGHIYGLPLLPLKEAATQWQAWRNIVADIGGNPYALRGASWPEGAVDPAYSNPGWIPLTHDGSGNHIGLDLAPWPGGRVGQVILFGRDEDVKAVLADSLGTFLRWIADLLEAGNFRLHAAADEVVLRPFRLNEPRVDDFHEGARIILGAPDRFL
jgi:cell wall assembly regulator SMI1